MTRFVLGVFGVVCITLLLASVPGRATAPVPKGATPADVVPDLKLFFTAVGKAVEAEKWPAEADEKALRDTARVIFERTLKAAEQKGRRLPVDIEKLTKADVAKEFKQDAVDNGFVIAGDVRLTTANNSVIFASGNVQITGATNCVIVAPNVRCTGVDNCIVIAGEYIRLTIARPRNGSDPSVLVAGQWIRTTVMDGTICHVIRPNGLPAPDEGKFAANLPHPAIRTNGANNVVFLNDRDETGANGPKNCTYLLQKTPIVK